MQGSDKKEQNLAKKVIPGVFIGSRGMELGTADKNITWSSAINPR